GAVTVASLQPMRTVPARCVFVCGLDDASFPRRRQPLAFDLITQHHRPGDRDARLDDRQLFLDVVLAAREQLHLTYVGHSQKDDSECAPSVLLAELLDLVDGTCTTVNGHPARGALTVRHPLQPWSPRYRDGRDPRLFTFSRASLPALGEGHDESAWFTAPMAGPHDLGGGDIALDHLLDFWKHPSRFFLRYVVEAYVRDEADADLTTEPFWLNSLDRWRVQDVLVRGAARPSTPEVRLARLRAAGQLPAFGVGDATFAELDDEVTEFLRQVHAHGERRRMAVHVQGPDFRIHGELDGITDEVLVCHRMAKLKAKDRIGAWLVHVVAALARHAGARLPERTVCIAKNATIAFRALSAADAMAMATLAVQGLRQGLRAPLPFFPESSHAFTEGLPDRDKAAAKARTKWLPGHGDIPMDSEDPSNELCWRGQEPLDTEPFEHWARAVFTAIGSVEVSL
ncbi:MAG: exodeoxyribonuclease V subunit gamma, partial [Planctomycetes bacterium]|nr:exodeoxyribonuclease V subunit gamma [Planctomycetota bacterium]